MPLCRTVSTYCSAPKGTFAPPLRLAGFDMQGKRLYTTASPEFSKRKRTDVAIRIGPVPKSVNSGALPYKNGALITRPNFTNCILPRTAMGGHCNGAVTEGENGCRTSRGGDSKPPPTCTEATTTGQDSSVTVLSDESRLVCPEVAVRFSGTLLSSRVGLLSACQTELESRLMRLQDRLRHKQLLLVHRHAHSQLTVRCAGSIDSTHTLAGTSKVNPQQSACGSHTQEAGGENRESVLSHLHHRLKQAAKMVDNEMTDVSSEEEKEEDDGEEDGEEEGSCEEVKERWEQSRVTIGSQWVWLEHKIAELNTQICQLDNTLQQRPSKEAFTFVASDVSSSGLCYPSNGTLRVVGGVLPNHKQVPPNGYVGHHHHQLPHLLLPDGVLGAKLQVKDLLCASLTRTFPALMEEEGYSAARTSRPLDRRARRKVIRIPSVPMTTREKCIETSHPHLSRPEDCPSRLWLDAAMSYTAACPPSLCAASSHKRRKVIRSDLEAYSASVLSGDTPTQTRGRKRQYSSQLSLQFDSSPIPSVASPGGHLDTPACTQPPVASGRKKRVLTAPAFDIDNIVIPYSVAASTRPEKLEYKEIITPSWRVMDASELLPPLPPPPPLEQVLSPPVENGEEVEMCPRRSSRVVGKREGVKRPKGTQEEEVTSDEAYLSRHERCEEQEKKRFFNFVTGSNRKRRPVSLTSDGGGGGVGSPAPVAERSKRKGYAVASPTCSEPDYVPSPQIVPWVSRKFPLMGDDLDALENPPPPPPRLSSSSSPLFPLTVIPIEPLPPKPHNSNSCSVPDTPLSSPRTPAAAEVCVIPQEWEVSNPPAAVIPPPPKEVIVVPTTPEDCPIILKLTKRS